MKTWEIVEFGGETLKRDVAGSIPAGQGTLVYLGTIKRTIPEGLLLIGGSKLYVRVIDSARDLIFQIPEFMDKVVSNSFIDLENGLGIVVRANCIYPSGETTLATRVVCEYVTGDRYEIVKKGTDAVAHQVQF